MRKVSSVFKEIKSLIDSGILVVDVRRNTATCIDYVYNHRMNDDQKNNIIVDINLYCDIKNRLIGFPIVSSPVKFGLIPIDLGSLTQPYPTDISYSYDQLDFRQFDFDVFLDLDLCHKYQYLPDDVLLFLPDISTCSIGERKHVKKRIDTESEVIRTRPYISKTGNVEFNKKQVFAIIEVYVFEKGFADKPLFFVQENLAHLEYRAEWVFIEKHKTKELIDEIEL